MAHLKCAATGVVVLIAIGWLVCASLAGIVGSSHDFRVTGWSDQEICRPCHTPHSSDSSVPPPLWNHELTRATYVLYDDSRLVVAAEQPGVASLLCLSCHDGTVGLDAFGGNPGGVFVSGDSLIGTVLSDDHPVGLPWQHQWEQNGEPPSDLCSNCHDIHSPSGWSPSTFGDVGASLSSPLRL